MRYGKISEAIWTDDKFVRLSDTSKLLFVYLLSCSKCNSVGIFSLGLGTIEDEFRHERPEIRDCIAELEDSGLARYDDGWFCFNRFLKWNAPVSPNHARQIATVLNDCVMQNAPVPMICNLLGSVRGVLSKLTYKSKDGHVSSYWEDFKDALDYGSVSAYLGGEEAFMACVSGKACGLDGKGLDKGSTSTGEVLPKDLARRNRNRQETETYKTRQDKTRSSLGLACDNAREEVSLFCSDGEVRKVSPMTVDKVMEMHPDWDMHLLNVRIQVLTSENEDLRPEGDSVDSFFLTMTAYFNGDTIQIPQNQFSAQKGDSMSPTEKNAFTGACGAYAEG